MAADPTGGNASRPRASIAIACSANFPALLLSIVWRRFTTAGAVAETGARHPGLARVTGDSGAALAAIAQKLPDLAPDAKVLGFNYDTGERYLSVPDFLPEEG